MNKITRHLTRGALIAALYAALCHLQNILIPGSATWAIQFRAAEALCVLAMLSPAAISGLSVGCFVFNLTYAGALPLDMAVGTLATCLAAAAMWKLRRWTPLALAMPAVFNAVLVGWELTVYVGGGFFINALYVAIGELAVLFSLGWLLLRALKKQGIAARIFG